MKRPILLLLFSALLFLLVTSCHRFFSETPVSKPFTPPFIVLGEHDTLIPAKPGGIWYMLPQSMIEVTVHTQRTELVKGPYAAFASKYLGIDNVITNNHIYWQLEDITIGTTPVPDPDHLYYVSLGDADSVEIAIPLELYVNPQGSITCAAGAGKRFTVGQSFMAAPQPDYSSVFKLHAESNLFEKIDTIIEQVMQDSIKVEKRVLRTKMIEKPIEQRAKETADLILKMREDRIRLLVGFQEIPYDPVTIKYLVDELERVEREYIELFTGLRLETKHSRSFFIIPKQSDDCVPIPMMRFSSQEGVSPASHSRGQLLYLQVCSEGVSEAISRFRFLNVHDTLKSQLPATGFVYRNPEWTKISVYLGNALQKEVGVQIPQFGRVERLPWNVTRFNMDPETGSVRFLQIP